MMSSLAGSHASDLDDLVQLAAEQIFKKLGSFAGKSELSTWVYGVCYRVLLKQRRWYRRWSVRFRFEQEGDPVTAVGAEALPNAEIERRERARLLHTALSQLSDKHRAVIVLHDLEELSIAEVASIVDCNELTARSRLRDARKRMRALLDADPAFTWGGRRELTPS